LQLKSRGGQGFEEQQVIGSLSADEGKQYYLRFQLRLGF
jgi:hypothetical protein